MLTPQAITSAAGIAAGRESIANYSALLAERKTMLTSTFAESERFSSARNPTEADRREALEKMERGRSSTAKVYSDLDNVQGSVATGISSILDWAASQKTPLVARSDQLVFATARQQNELQGLLATLAAAEAKQQQVLQEVAASKQSAQASMRGNNEKLQQMLK